MNNVETFFSQYEKTLSALTAFSTFAAVVVSLWLARRADETRLKVYVSGTKIIHSTVDPEHPPRFISVNVTNTGTLPLRIQLSFFFWKLPFCKESWLITPYDFFNNPGFIPQRLYPVVIAPKHSETLCLSEKGVFETEMRRSFQRIKYMKWIRAYFIRAMVCTDDGTLCKGTISKELRKEIIALAREEA